MLPITQKMLIDWAGPQVFRDAQILADKGLVQDVVCEPPLIHGSILWCNRPLKTAIRMLPDGTAENRCPCRDSQERGIICAHAIALCIEALRRANDPARTAARQEELRRAARLARLGEGDYLQRVKPDTPGAIPAQLHLILRRDWRAAFRAGGHIPLRAVVECRNQTVPLEALAPDAPLTFHQTEEAILFVLEDIAGGPVRGPLEVGPADFINLLELHAGLPLKQEDAAEPVTVHATRLVSYLKLTLDEATGELLLAIHTELPLSRPGDSPCYLFAGRAGWILTAANVWPLEQILPEPLRSAYDQPVRIPRTAVPRFMQTELPALSRFMRLETDLALDLFTIEPAVPQFRLVVRGSPASLAATLYAHYGEGLALPAGKPDPAGHFAIPDPADILRYTVRNLPAETRAWEQLTRLGFGSESDGAPSLVGTRAVLNFLGGQLPAIRRMGWKIELEGKAQTFMDGLSSATPVVQIARPPEGGWFEVGFHFEDTAGASLTPAEVQRALLKGEAFLERDGRVILLDADAIRSMMDVFKDCISREGAEPGTFRMADIYAEYVNASLEALDGVDIEAGPGWRETAQGRQRAMAAPLLELPPAMETVLRGYQKDGVKWLRHLEANLFGGILADEMGLGKTVETLVWLQLERCHLEARRKPALIVCPSSLVENWAAEAQRFVPALRVLPIMGADRHSRWSEIAGADIAVTSYALLRRDLENYLHHEFAVVVLDEAQHIKNHSTQNAMAAKQLKAQHRLVLTGTPIENSVTDLWSIMDFLMPGYLGGYEAFHRNYELPIAQGSAEGEAAQRKLRRKLYPFLLRRLKSEVAADLPARIERTATCALTPDQKTIYLQLLDASRRKLADLVARQGFQKSRMEVLKTLLRLRQICCHLDLLRLPALRAEAPSAKMELFFELLDEALDGGHRVLVFSQFVAMLTILRRELEARSLSYCYLDGATQDRLAIVREFNTNRFIPLFLISLKAGGTGLNLTGADMVIHFDPWWNPAVEDQATDRAHRIGQKKTVYSVKLITRGTVEEKVVALQQKKKAVIDATLAREAGALPQFTWEEVLDLLDTSAANL